MQPQSEIGMVSGAGQGGQDPFELRLKLVKTRAVRAKARRYVYPIEFRWSAVRSPLL